jgi:hypothetical protein
VEPMASLCSLEARVGPMGSLCSLEAGVGFMSQFVQP